MPRRPSILALRLPATDLVSLADRRPTDGLGMYEILNFSLFAASVLTARAAVYIWRVAATAAAELTGRGGGNGGGFPLTTAKSEASAAPLASGTPNLNQCGPHGVVPFEGGLTR
jgi:hypothetical protein